MSEPNNELEESVYESDTNNNLDVTYKQNDVIGDNETLEQQDQLNEQEETAEEINQNDMYENVLNQQTSMEQHSYNNAEHNFKSDDRLPTLSRSQMNRSIVLKPSIHHAVVNEFKYIGPQIKVGKFDPNSRSLNEEIFQRTYQKRLSELENKQNAKARPTSASSHKSLINPIIFQTNDFKFKGTQFRHGKYISPIDLSKENGKAIVTSSSFSNEATFEEKFQRKFQDRLEKLMPKEKVKTLSYFEIKELHERFLLNNRR